MAQQLELTVGCKDRILCDLLTRLHEGFVKGAIAKVLMSVTKLGNYSSTSYVSFFHDSYRKLWRNHS